MAMYSRRNVSSPVLIDCLSLSGFHEISQAVFETGTSSAEKAKQERKRLQNVYAPTLRVLSCVLLTSCLWKSKWREWVLGIREYIYAILVMWSAPNARDKIKGADVVVGTNHVTFLTNRFSRLISLLTSTMFVSRKSGITAIFKI